MELAEEVEKQGFAIVAEVLTHSGIERLGECLTQDSPPRSRARTRRALRHTNVLAIARNPRLLNITR